MAAGDAFRGKLDIVEIWIIFLFILAQPGGAVRRRLVGGAGTAAPAVVLRKHGSGRRRVTVRPN
jgi:hypothetical protein